MKKSFVFNLITFGLLISVILSAIPSQVLAETDFQAELERYVADREERTASVSMAFFDSNNVLAEVRHGFLNEEDQIAASDENAVYEWGSVSKMLVWVTVMQLAEEGKLDLEADLSTLVPEEVLHKRRYSDKLTMTHLMNHNAGFLEMTFNSETEDVSEIRDLKEALIRFAPTQAHRPGEVVAYSNWGAALAGWIVEEISGKPFAEVVRACPHQRFRTCDPFRRRR